MEEYQTPLASALAALITIVTTYYTKLKKHFDKIVKIDAYLYGDADRKGAITRLREAEAAIKALQDQDKDELDLNAVILKQQEAIKEALKPIYIQLEKKADKALFDVQVEHLMEAIERIGRGN